MFAHVAFAQGRQRRIIEGIEELASENGELISKNEVQGGGHVPDTKNDLQPNVAQQPKQRFGWTAMGVR